MSSTTTAPHTLSHEVPSTTTRRIEIYDTTLRDGTQGEGFNLSLQDKLLIAQKLADGPSDTFTIMNALYSQLNPRLRKAAERNVLAHLLKMEAERKAQRDGEVWRAA